MKKWGLLAAIGLCLVAVVWLGLHKKEQEKARDTLVYIDYDSQHKDTIKSETSYIKDTQSQSTFQVCQSHKGAKPCKEVEGILHGVQKWYDGDILQYEVFYEHGNRMRTIAYYPSGAKKKECIYRDNKLLQTDVYKDGAGNPRVEAIFFKNNEKIKEFYNNGKIYKVEKYHNNRLVSRRIYNSDGRLEHLEEYQFIGNGIDIDSFFEGFDSVNPFLHDQDQDIFDERRRPPQPSTRDSFWI